MSRFHASTDELPSSPPPEVLQQLDFAWERARELFKSTLELHFEVDSYLGHAWAELRMPDGALVERLSASEAIAIACGDATVQFAIAA
jgi:hypothetical protein